jgi:hypothetical protein
VRHCPSWRIEEEQRYVVVEVVAWSGDVVHFGTSGTSSEYFGGDSARPSTR